MITSFGNKQAKDIWEFNQSKSIPRKHWLRAKALLVIMYSSTSINDLKIKGQPPNIRLHKLKGDKKNYWSVTIKLPWCITFKFEKGEYSDVRIENYH